MSQIAKANEEGRRQSLARFGYQPTNGHDHSEPPEQAWERLKSDFKASPGNKAPNYGDLDPRVRFRIDGYIEQRARLDRLMDACDAGHLRILREGPAPALVEAYALARDTYEDAVEDFATLRDLVQEALSVLAGD